MLYGAFKIMISLTSVMGILHMLTIESYQYICFPLFIIIGVIYSLFDENDKEYRERFEYNSSTTWSYNNNKQSTANNTTYYRTKYNTNTNTNTYTYIQNYNNRKYKGFNGKCHRSVKITNYKTNDQDD